MTTNHEISESVVLARASMDADGETERIREIDDLQVRSTEANPALDAVIEQVRALLDVPIASVTIVLEEEQWFKSQQGLPVDRTPREVAFCTHVVASGESLVVSDARTDPVFAGNPLIEDPGVVAYAGAPVRTDRGFVVGTLCAIDHEAREFDEDDVALLEALADRVAAELEAIRSRTRLDALVDASDLYSPAQFLRLARIEGRRHQRRGIAMAMAVIDWVDGSAIHVADGALELNGWIRQGERAGIILPDGTAASLERLITSDQPHRIEVLEPDMDFESWFEGLADAAGAGA